MRTGYGSGSSPLTRGKHDEFAQGTQVGGLIPAHAGKTKSVGSSVPGEGAHPRSRGENRSPTRWATGESGSSPLTRGKRYIPPQRHAAARLIPAHAGKTPYSHLLELRSRAHPRSRGENAKSHGTPPRLMGSSPLTRGKQSYVRGFGALEGLIPAHAGKTTR